MSDDFKVPGDIIFDSMLLQESFPHSNQAIASVIAGRKDVPDRVEPAYLYYIIKTATEFLRRKHGRIVAQSVLYMVANEMLVAEHNGQDWAMADLQEGSSEPALEIEVKEFTDDGQRIH